VPSVRLRRTDSTVSPATTGSPYLIFRLHYAVQVERWRRLCLLNFSSEHGGGVLTNLFVTKFFVMPAPGISDNGGKI
jgi:hypothetical protein